MSEKGQRLPRFSIVQYSNHPGIGRSYALPSSYVQEDVTSARGGIAHLNGWENRRQH
jgi:hypothetical protein